MHRNRTGRKLVGRGLISLVSALTMVTLAASAAAAAGTLDQSFEPMPDSGSIDITPTVGQTFTAGITGALDQIDLGLSRGTRSDASATIEIRTTTVDGLPTDTVLASTSVPTASITMEPAFVPIPLGPVPVTADTKYAIVITGQGFHFHGAYAGGYPGGGAVVRLDTAEWREDPADFSFRTYVTTPPPCRLLRLSLAPLLPSITICL